MIERATLRRAARLLPLVLLLPAVARATAGSATAHGSALGTVAAALALILVAAKVGASVAVRLRQPAVLGELLMGIVLGNLVLVGVGGLDPLKTDPSLDLLAGLGVIILLFEVGLESTVRQMMKVGISSLLVAVVGVVTPFGLGWLVGRWLLPGANGYVHVFLGAILTATSVGITARVLKDLGRSRSPEARVILGAAVIDDVLGLVILAVVTGIIGAANGGHALGWIEIVVIVAKAATFLGVALALGVTVSRRLFALASRLSASGVLLAAGLAFCFLLSWLAQLIGLETIIGAFAAGLILEDTHYTSFSARGEHRLEETVQPISQFLVPIFFVLMGMRTDLRAFADVRVLGLAALLIVVAVGGKQACSLVVRGRDVDRLSVGIGMIPRGEVGLIFARIGAALTIHGEPVVSRGTFSAVLVMVVATTMMTPPLLGWSLRRGEARAAPPA